MHQILHSNMIQRIVIISTTPTISTQTFNV